MKNSFRIPIIGNQRSGKSFAAARIIDSYVKHRGIALVYNFGKDSDFPADEYETIRPLTFAEHIQYFYSSRNDKRNYSLNKKIEYFFWRGRIYHFAKFCEMFWMKKVRMFRISSEQEDNAFFEAVFLYFGRVLLVIDDCRAIFRNGFKQGHIDIFSRSNHCGTQCTVKGLQGKGIDIISIWHTPEHLNPDAWYYATSVILFRFPFLPKLPKIDNPMLEKIIVASKNKLDKLPQYYFIEISIEADLVASIRRPLNILK